MLRHDPGQSALAMTSIMATSFLTPLHRRAAQASTTTRALAKTLIFLFKVFPMLPSRWLNPLTPRPIVERLAYQTSHGEAQGDLYRPSTPGPHPGIVVCLGVVPFGVDHPQVPRLGEALARSGFAALLYWSPAMRDFRLDTADIDDIASAYDALLARADVDGSRSGLLGTCVGGAFALMAAASPTVRDRVSFVLAYAAYASVRSLVRDVASASRSRDGVRESWAVDPLTRKVFLHTITAHLDPAEANLLRARYATRSPATEQSTLSDGARRVLPLLTELTLDATEAALDRLPPELSDRLVAMSPATYLRDLRTPLVVLLHDREDPVIPVSESRQLRDALAGRARYTEFTVFRHLDPTRGKPAPLPLAKELIRFTRAVYPAFRRATEESRPPSGAARAPR